MEDKFSSMYQNGRMVQVGMYLRNQKIRDYAFKELSKRERNAKMIHGNIKDAVKFEVRRIKKEEQGTLLTPELHCVLNIGTYEITKQGSKPKFTWRIFKEKFLNWIMDFKSLQKSSIN